jgi:mRNA interferase MazF
MLEFGSIVLVPFPFTDLSGMKVRPAVVISNKNISDDIILAFISTNAKRRGKFEVLLKMNGKNGLKSDSVVLVSKIATLEKKMILGTIGKLSNEEIVLIKTKLKSLFDL